VIKFKVLIVRYENLACIDLSIEGKLWKLYRVIESDTTVVLMTLWDTTIIKQLGDFQTSMDSLLTKQILLFLKESD
jgi:hypothetical protein